MLRGLHRPRYPALLPLLGSRPDPDVLPHRLLGRAAADTPR